MYSTYNNITKVWATINGIKLPGIMKDNNKFMLFFNGFWFHYIPDAWSVRELDLDIDRSDLIKLFTVKEKE